MRGLYFEEMEDGAQFTHPFTRTVTEMDDVNSTLSISVTVLVKGCVNCAPSSISSK